MRLILLGPPGSGKGTQAKLLCPRFGLVHIGTGDILRQAVRRQTPAGKQAEPFVVSGRLVPDALVNDLVGDHFRSAERPDRFVMDGYPRTLAQAQAFDAVLRPLREAAELLAERDDWPPLYDPSRLAANEIPVSAAVYYNDMYVDRDFSMRTAGSIRGLRAWVTSEYEHDGLRVSAGAVLDRLIGLTAGSAFYLQIFCDRLVQHLNRNRLAFITESVVGDVLGQLTTGPSALPLDKFDPLITAAGESVALAPKERYLTLLTRIALNPSTTSQEVGSEDAPLVRDLFAREVLERDASGRLPASTCSFGRAGCDAAVQQCLAAGKLSGVSVTAPECPASREASAGASRHRTGREGGGRGTGGWLAAGG